MPLGSARSTTWFDDVHLELGGAHQRKELGAALELLDRSTGQRPLNPLDTDAWLNLAELGWAEKSSRAYLIVKSAKTGS